MNKRKKAFTLVELQVASVIALFTLSAVLALYLFSWRSFAIGSTLLDVYSNSRIASGYLTRDIRCTAQVVSSYGSYVTSDNSIVLKVKSIGPLGDVISPNCDYIAYELRNAPDGRKDLYRIVMPDASSSRTSDDRFMAHYCESLIFSSGGIDLSSIGDLSLINTISIYLPINKSTMSLSGAETSILSLNPTTVVRLRNK